MTTSIRKLGVVALAWVMFAAPFIAFVPTAAAHTAPATGGAHTLDVDFSGDHDDDIWLTDPVEWGEVDADLELRHILGSDVGLGSDARGVGDDYDDSDITEDVILCNPEDDNVETLDDVDVESDTNFGDEENVDTYDETGFGDDFTVDDPPYFDDPRDAFSTDLDDDTDGFDPDDTADPNDPATLDDNDDGSVSDTEKQDEVDDDASVGDEWDDSDLVLPAAKGTFKEVTFEMGGVWYVLVDDGDGVCELGGDDTTVSQFLVEPASVLEVSVNPATLTFAYDDDDEEPEPEDLSTTVTVEWGGDAMENAEVTLWACSRERPAYWYCDDDIDVDSSDVDPIPLVGADDGVDLTGGDGQTDYDDDFPGAGTYLVSATCILQDEDDAWLDDPENLDEATHECVDPEEIEGVDNPADVPDFDGDGNDAAGEIETDEVEAGTHLRGNTTLTIAPGTLEVEQVKGADIVEGRVTEVVWKLTYEDTETLSLADNTHGTESGATRDNPYANEDGNFTLDITLPNGKHVLLGNDMEDADDDGVTLGTDTDEDVEDLDGVLQCDDGEDADLDCEVDDTAWGFQTAEDTTDCDLFAGDGEDCPVFANPGDENQDGDCADAGEDGVDVDGDSVDECGLGGDDSIVADDGDVDVVTVPDDEDDFGEGLDPRVYLQGDDAGEDADWGVYLTVDPAIDNDDPDSANFREIDDPEGDFEDEQLRLGYLAVFVPWASGTYRFELRLNHFSDEHPEYVGEWTLNVAAAPEFGFTDVLPTFDLEVPARTGTTPEDPDDWVFDPVEDVDVEFEEDAEDEDDNVFSYVLAFRIVDSDNHDINAYPCNGGDNDGDTIDADGEEADYPGGGASDDENDDDIVFWPVDSDDRDCADFEYEDDLTVSGDLLYTIEDDWIAEISVEAGEDALDECLTSAPQGTGFDEGDVDDSDATGDFDEDTTYEETIDGLDTDAADDPALLDVQTVNHLMPLYCVYNVVPMSPAPVTITAMIDGEPVTLEYNVSEGGFARVIDVTAHANSDGTIKVTVTNKDGSAVTGDMALFERGDSPDESDNKLVDEDGDAITSSGGTFTLSEDDDIDTARLGVYVLFDGSAENTLDYAYARVNLEPGPDLDVEVTPARVTAGVEETFDVNVTAPEDDEDDLDTFEAFFLTAYDYARVQRDGVLYIDSPDYREDDVGFTETGDKFDFAFDLGDNSEELTLKAEGPYHVYVRDTDHNHDNNGTMPVVEVVPPAVTFTPGRIAFALEEDVEVTVGVKDADGGDIDGTLRVVYDPDNDELTSDDYGFAIIGGSDVDNAGTEDDKEFGGIADLGDVDDLGDDFDWTYLEYRDDDDLVTETTDGVLPEVSVTNGEGALDVTVEDIGPIHWVFMADEGDLWVNTTGMLELVPPQITLTPDRLTAGIPADVSVNVKDLGGQPVADLPIAICGAPLSTGTGCTGVVATDDSGNAIVTVVPGAQGTLELWIHESVEGDEAGDCDIDQEDFARINPTSGAPITEADADALDTDCDAPAAGVTNEDFQFEDTGVIVQVVATQSLLRVTVPDAVQVNTATNIAVSRGGSSGAQTPVSGASVTIMGPTGASVFTGTTNAAGQVSFTPNAAGTYTVKATSAGFQDGSASFTAREGPVDTSGDFQIVSFSIDPATVTVGETVEGRATVKNVGASTGTATVILLVDGAQRATQAVTLNAGETLSVAFDFTPSVAKSSKLAVKIGSLVSPEQTLTVNAKGTGTDGGPGDEPEPVIPGFEAVFALAAIGVALAVLGRRKK